MAWSSPRRTNIAGDGAHQPAASRRRRLLGAHRRRASEKGEGPYRVVARRVATGDGSYVVYVARSLEGVARSTDNLERLLWWSLPALLALMGARHLGGDRPCAASGRGDPPGGRGDRRRGPPPARARTRQRGRDRPPRPHDERDARPARGRHRSATALRRRRQPRAAQPAHRDPRAARGRPRASGARRLAGHRARACSPTRSGCSDWSTTCSPSRSSTRRHSTPRTARRSTSTRSCSPRPVVCTRAARSSSTRARCRARRSTATPTSSLRVVRNLLDNAARHARSQVVVSFVESSDRRHAAGRRRRSRHPRRRP